MLLPLLLALDLFSNDAPANRTWPAPSEGVKDLTFYVMGADASGASGNYWTTMDVPPTPAYTDYFFVPGPGGAVGAGVLSPSPPPASAGAGVGPFVYDPAKPVPTVGGNNLEIPCGPLDQTPLEQAGRGDLLLFTSAPLAAPLALTGALEATVYISTNVTDTDVTVKLVDVYPADAPTNAGKALIVADGIVRMKWRDAPAGTWDPQPLSGSPADVYAARVTLWNTSYVFAPGHSIRVHVSSSNYPRFLPNLNTGCPLSAPCGNATAATTLHTDAAAGRASKITLPVVTLDQLPPFDVAAAEGALLERHAPRWQAAAPGRKGGAQGLREWLAPRLERVGAAIARRAGGGARRR